MAVFEASSGHGRRGGRVLLDAVSAQGSFHLFAAAGPPKPFHGKSGVLCPWSQGEAHMWSATRTWAHLSNHTGACAINGWAGAVFGEAITSWAVPSAQTPVAS